WTCAAVSCATTARQCSKPARSTMTAAMRTMGSASEARSRPAKTCAMSQPKSPSRATPKPIAARPMSVAHRMRRRTPLVKIQRRGSKCILSLRDRATVIGIAGGAEKCAWIIGALGFDAALDYKAGPLPKALKAAAPDGIDVYFDNVG